MAVSTSETNSGLKFTLALLAALASSFSTVIGSFKWLLSVALSLQWCFPRRQVLLTVVAVIETSCISVVRKNYLVNTRRHIFVYDPTSANRLGRLFGFVHPLPNVVCISTVSPGIHCGPAGDRWHYFK
jgi:hypothetical protein